MKGCDKALQARVIAELSQGSVHWEHVAGVEKDIDVKVKALKRKAKDVKTKELKIAEERADSLIREWEGEEVTGEWCVLVDMDMFFAAVEMRENPTLRDKPMVVGSPSMVSTANYAARQYGVRSAMPGFIARELVSRQGGTLIFIKPNMAKYKAASKQLTASLRSHSPDSLYHRSIDEAYMNITSLVTARMEASNEPPRQAAEAVVSSIRAAVFSDLGLTASAGIAPNMALAKLAADVNKPNGQFCTPTERAAIREWLSDQPVRRIHGVGHVTERLLKEGLGVHTMGDVFRQRGLLLATMGVGKKTPQAILKGALGMGPTHYSEKPARSTGAERTFNTGLVKQESQVKALHAVTREAFKTLESRTPERLTLRIKTSLLEMSTRSVVIPKAMRQRPFTLEDAIAIAEGVFLKEPTDEVRLLGVRFDLA
eukprot:TRINITY_DN23611_c0_g1_i1.p1 TRINITY_DN23611_c0_g1~~TRINITY_DN23611_c0_g1_i1.p1  ORF type:complete len:467 (+),score=35.50 TRINITY_DN23611_c0_g1_i1:122-1402(+)